MPGAGGDGVRFRRALRADAVAKTDLDISQLARQTGRWHHQIKIDGKAESFARSVPLGPDAANWSVRELFQSEVAQKIDEAIDWIDSNVTGDPLVRLLIVPAYHLHAFWLKEGDASRVLVVDMPASFTRPQYNKLYTSKEFLEALTEEQHVIGISVTWGHGAKACSPNLLLRQTGLSPQPRQHGGVPTAGGERATPADFRRILRKKIRG